MSHGCCAADRKFIAYNNITDVKYEEPCTFCCCCCCCCQKGKLTIYAKDCMNPIVPLSSKRAHEVRDGLIPVVEANARGDTIRIHVMP